MKYIFNLLNKIKMSVDYKRIVFLLFTTLFYSAIGYIAWYIIHFFILNKSIYGICFAGYCGLFIGLFGGILFLYNAKNQSF